MIVPLCCLMIGVVVGLYAGDVADSVDQLYWLKRMRPFTDSVYERMAAAKSQQERDQAMLADLREELLVTERLLDDRESVLRAIPACQEHGSGCIPHALKWIEEAAKALEERKQDHGETRIHER